MERIRLAAASGVALTGRPAVHARLAHARERSVHSPPGAPDTGRPYASGPVRVR